MSATTLFQSPVSQSRKYRPDIDGLRAVAVLPVVLFHAGYKAFSGGFVGVDIFFVISGFLITSILTEDIQCGGFSLASFYERRLRRIFPPLFVMAACCMVVAFVLYPPDHLLRFGKSLIAMTFFVSNLFFWREAPGGGYFAETGRSFDTDALLHTWSLSVEEQFYVFFPWALYALHRWARHREFAVLSAAIVFSFALSAWGLERAPAATFYLLTTRSWELLLGAVAAKWILRFPETRWLRETLSIIGVGLIAYAVFCFTKDTPFPGPNAIFPCVGAFLIIFAGMGGPSSVGAVLSTRPAVSIGVISYSLYLWHWPLIAFLKYFHAGEQAQLNKPLVIAASLAFAVVSFLFVEKPFRGKKTDFSRQQIFGLGFAASASCVACGLVIIVSGGLPMRFAPDTMQIVAENMNTIDDTANLGECWNWKKEVHSVSDIALCEINAKPAHNALFWGDSHVGQLYPLIQKMNASQDLSDKGIIFAVSGSCPPVERFNFGEGFHCNDFAHYAMLRALQDDIDTIFIGFATWFTVTDEQFDCLLQKGRCVSVTKESYTRELIAELTEDIATLRAHGKKVVIFLPFPIFDKSPPYILARNAMLGRFGIAQGVHEVSSPDLREKLVTMAAAAGADVFDPRVSLCRGDGCLYQKDGISLYSDQHHIAAGKIDILEDQMQQALLHYSDSEN